MKLNKAFIFPSFGKSSSISNPYTDDFMGSLSKHVEFLNKSKPSKIGILNLFVYLGKINIAFFNWVEELPDKKGGIPQTIFFILLIFILKIKKIKIFYTFHNKESHYKTKRYLKKLLVWLLLSKADFVLCHSSEGLKILNKKGIKGKIMYIPHPFRRNIANKYNYIEKKYDILIWGAIRPYKGIDVYLKFLESKNLLDKYKTLIIGKIFPEEYENELIKYKSAAIQIANMFIDDDTLNELIVQSKIVLFTYNENTVLSSGALIYSLSLKASVIGPNTGAFKDLYQEGLIEVFNTYDDLIEKINVQINSPINNMEKINGFIQENSWDAFGTKIADWINTNL